MRKLAILLVTFLGVFSGVKAQDAAVKDMAAMAQKTPDKKDDAKKGKWTKGGLFNLNATQTSFSNWVPAGVDEKYNITGALYVNLFANKTIGKWNWDNNLDLFLAYQNTKLLGGRKIDDRLDITSRISRQLKKKSLFFTTIGNLRTQVFNGYNYISPTVKQRTSGLFAPAVLTIAPGFSWKPNANFSAFLSPIAGRATFVTNGPNEIAINLAQTKPYGVDPSETVKWEFGYFLSLAYRKEIFKNVTYSGRVDVYGNYLNADTKKFKGGRPDKADVFLTNILAMKVNNWLNVTYGLDLIYDDDTKIRNNKASAQIRSLLGVGFAYKF
jgi:hypothetical protein